MTQPDNITISETNYDTLSIIAVDDHLLLIQNAEDGDSETLVIGPGQQEELLVILQVARAARQAGGSN